MGILSQPLSKINDFYDQNILFDTLQVRKYNGYYMKAKKSAIRQHPGRYDGVQINSKDYINALAFDCDHEDVLEFTDFELPIPTLTIINKDNGKHHHLYYLKNPIPLFCASKETTDFFADLYDGMSAILNADINYTGLITKNFINHNKFRVYGSLEKYVLNDFSEFTKNKNEILQQYKLFEQQTYTSRHIKLFDTLRYYAYGVADKSKSYNELYALILKYAEQINYGFESPINVKYIVKSVSDFCWKNRENFSSKNWNWDGYIKKSKEEVANSHKLRHQRDWMDKLSKRFRHIIN